MNRDPNLTQNTVTRARPVGPDTDKSRRQRRATQTHIDRYAKVFGPQPSRLVYPDDPPELRVPQPYKPPWWKRASDPKNQPYLDMPWGTVFDHAVSNIPSNSGQVVADTLRGLYEIGAGAATAGMMGMVGFRAQDIDKRLQKNYPALSALTSVVTESAYKLSHIDYVFRLIRDISKGKQIGSEALAKSMREPAVRTVLFDMMVELYKQNWGLGDDGVTGLKRYIAEQPMDFLSDIATVLTMGASGVSAAAKSGSLAIRSKNLLRFNDFFHRNINKFTRNVRWKDGLRVSGDQVKDFYENLAGNLDKFSEKARYIGTGVEGVNYPPGFWAQMAHYLLTYGDLGNLPAAVPGVAMGLVDKKPWLKGHNAPRVDENEAMLIDITGGSALSRITPRDPAVEQLADELFRATHPEFFDDPKLKTTYTQREAYLTYPTALGYDTRYTTAPIEYFEVAPNEYKPFVYLGSDREAIADDLQRLETWRERTRATMKDELNYEEELKKLNRDIFDKIGKDFAPLEDLTDAELAQLRIERLEPKNAVDLFLENVISRENLAYADTPNPATTRHLQLMEAMQAVGDRLVEMVAQEKNPDFEEIAVKFVKQNRDNAYKRFNTRFSRRFGKDAFGNIRLSTGLENTMRYLDELGQKRNNFGSVYQSLQIRYPEGDHLPQDYNTNHSLYQFLEKWHNDTLGATEKRENWIALLRENLDTMTSVNRATALGLIDNGLKRYPETGPIKLSNLQEMIDEVVLMGHDRNLFNDPEFGKLMNALAMDYYQNIANSTTTKHADSLRASVVTKALRHSTSPPVLALQNEIDHHIRTPVAGWRAIVIAENYKDPDIPYTNQDMINDVIADPGFRLTAEDIDRFVADLEERNRETQQWTAEEFQDVYDEAARAKKALTTVDKQLGDIAAAARESIAQHQTVMQGTNEWYTDALRKKLKEMDDDDLKEFLINEYIHRINTDITSLFDIVDEPTKNKIRGYLLSELLEEPHRIARDAAIDDNSAFYRVLDTNEPHQNFFSHMGEDIEMGRGLTAIHMAIKELNNPEIAANRSTMMTVGDIQVPKGSWLDGARYNIEEWVRYGYLGDVHARVDHPDGFQEYVAKELGKNIQAGVPETYFDLVRTIENIPEDEYTDLMYGFIIELAENEGIEAVAGLLQDSDSFITEIVPDLTDPQDDYVRVYRKGKYSTNNPDTAQKIIEYGNFVYKEDPKNRDLRKRKQLAVYEGEEVGIGNPAWSYVDEDEWTVDQDLGRADEAPDREVIARADTLLGVHDPDRWQERWNYNEREDTWFPEEAYGLRPWRPERFVQPHKRDQYEKVFGPELTDLIYKYDELLQKYPKFTRENYEKALEFGRRALQEGTRESKAVHAMAPAFPLLGNGDVDIGRIELILGTIGGENAALFLGAPGVMELLLQSVPASKRGRVRTWLAETRRAVHRSEETRRESESRSTLRYAPSPTRSALDRLGGQLPVH